MVAFATDVEPLNDIMMTETELAASICRDSFFEFVKEFWDEVIAEKPVWNWHIPYLCAQAQAAAERVFAGKPKRYDYIINIPPGTTKSTILSIMFPAWCWSRFPAARFICGSYTEPLALDLARKSRDVIQSAKYREYFPEVAIDSDQNTKSYYCNTEGGMRKSVGVGSSVIGFHAHFIIVDDPVDPVGASSDEILKSANEWMSETLANRKVDKEVSILLLIMQRLSQNDPTGFMTSKKGERIKWIRLPADTTHMVSPPHLKRYYVDGMLDPVRLSKRILTDSMIKMGLFAYSCQFDQTPIPRGGGMFHIYKIKIEHAPVIQRFVKIIRYWDKAATADGGAYTVGFKMGVDVDGHYWILHVKRGQWDSYTREQIILQTARSDGYEVHIRLEQEPGSSGVDSVRDSVKRLAGFTVRTDRVTGKKPLRADPFSTQVNAGNVSMVPGDWNQPCLDEMQFFPNSTYKDQVDAGGGAFNELVYGLGMAGAL